MTYALAGLIVGYVLGFATPVLIHWITIRRDPWERRQRLRKRMRKH